jgi:hypothetical protein
VLCSDTGSQFDKDRMAVVGRRGKEVVATYLGLSSVGKLVAM